MCEQSAPAEMNYAYVEGTRGATISGGSTRCASFSRTFPGWRYQYIIHLIIEEMLLGFEGHL
jgi:hypothetical protein